MPFSHDERFAKAVRASVKVRKSRRISGRSETSGGLLIQRAMIFAKYGPTAESSVSNRPCSRISAASSGQRNARREARRNAFFAGILAVSDSRANSSEICALFSICRVAKRRSHSQLDDRPLL